MKYNIAFHRARSISLAVEEIVLEAADLFTFV
jgi:hypothetical protein